MIHVASHISVRPAALVLGAVIWMLGIATMQIGACEQHGAAHAHTASGLQVSQAWSPPAPPAVGVQAGYFTLANWTATPRVLVSATSPQYEQIDMHRTTITNGLAAMHAVTSLPLAASERVQFVPGGLHLMMRRATRKRQTGDRFPVTLHFQNGETLTFDMTVENVDMGHSPSTQPSDHNMHQHHKHHVN